jgi:acyl-CoA thioester hydrolase
MVVQIYYEDTDHSGFVYHANYLKYCERAREHLIGVNYLRDLYHNGLHFVVAKAELKFHAPARHGDSLCIESEANFSRSPAIPFKQNIFQLISQQDSQLNSQQEIGQLLVSTEITIVALNRENRPIRMPDDVLSYFSKKQMGEAQL